MEKSYLVFSDFTNYFQTQICIIIFDISNYSYQFIPDLWFVKGYSEQKTLGSSVIQIDHQLYLEKQVSDNLPTYLYTITVVIIIKISTNYWMSTCLALFQPLYYINLFNPSNNCMAYFLQVINKKTKTWRG